MGKAQKTREFFLIIHLFVFYYNSQVDLMGNDSEEFVNSVIKGDSDTVRSLIVDYGFVPLRAIVPRPEELVYRVSKVDMALMDHLIIRNGLDVAAVNEGVMRRVVTDSDFAADMLASYLARGFTLTPQSIKVALRKCDQATLLALRSYMPDEQLRPVAEEVLVDNFGPDFVFSSGLFSFLQYNFEISDAVMARALFVNPGAAASSSAHRQSFSHDTVVSPAKDTFTPAANHWTPEHEDSPISLPRPSTRCFHQPKPTFPWRSILVTYGPDHPFTHACFTDTLLRITQTDGAVRPITYEFLAAGVQFTPVHVKYLTAIAMRSSGYSVLLAHDLLERLREQVSELYDEEGDGAWDAGYDCCSASQVKDGGADEGIHKDGNAVMGDRNCGEIQEWIAAFEETLASLPRLKPAPRDGDGGGDGGADGGGGGPAWASRGKDPAFPAAWFGRDMAGMLAGLKKVLG
ncbi:hypothetical protein HK104_000964 [Borealophlyctis nickersoniae]|nr:hypothetical protein HK104_000964 [Borealophlyctis nickersoniae]